MFGMFGGTLKIRLVCADPMGIISELASYGVIVREAELIDDVTAMIVIERVDEKSVVSIFTAKDISFNVINQNGLMWGIGKVLRRPILLCGILLFVVMTIFIPSRILFICVEGNDSVPSEEILSVAEEMGVHFGSSGKSIRSEKVKNYLLEKIPELQWAGVNTRGCVAAISVKERDRTNDTVDPTGICSIVATRDGVIRQMTVHSGKPLCTLGQSVREGQVLVSGFEDCGIFIRAQSADAEIFADTIRVIKMKSPLIWQTNGEKKATEKKYSVIFGKKRINLFKDTGISDVSCVKMYRQYYINLPGNFVLPFSVVEYTKIFYESEALNLGETDDFEWIELAADMYLQSQMLSGSIMSREMEMAQTVDSQIYYVTYACREMIGQLRVEENYTKNE